MQAKGTSQAIVRFIARLAPLYLETFDDNRSVALSLRDGTRMFSIDEEPDDEDGWIRVHWQGAPDRESIVQGVYVAQIALLDYVRFHAAGRPELERAELGHLANHFELKTGKALPLGSSTPTEDVLRLTSKVLDKLGTAAALEALRKLLG